MSDQYRPSNKTTNTPALTQTPQGAFGQMVQMVVGQAFAAAGYVLQDNPIHQARGLFRYQKQLADGVMVYIEFQLLYYQGGGQSRFRVNLLRNVGPDARTSSGYADRVDTTLSALLWNVFDVQTLDSPDHWWLFNTPNALGHAVAEAGKLTIGFGMPWLEGTLRPDRPTDGQPDESA